MVIHGRIAYVFVLSATLFALSDAFAQSRTESAFIPGQFLVRLTTPVGQLNERDTANFESQVRGHVLRVHVRQNFLVIQKPVMQSFDSSIADLRSSAQTVFAEPNTIFEGTRIPNDPDIAKLWGLNNFGQADNAKQTGLSGIDIDAERAWDITTGSKQVVIAVLDSGVDLTHPDLAPNLWINEVEANGAAGVDDDGNGIIDDINGANFVNVSRPTGNPTDDNGHGTHCSGTIGGRGNDGQGIAGVNWNVRIIAVKFLNANGSGSLESAIMAVDYATRMGAKIQSHSWAGGTYSKLLEEAIQRADAAGVLLVIASSNSGGDNDIQPVYPATYNVPNIISVAAIDNRGSLASFSNYGRTTVHMAAPGVNIYSAKKGGKYESMSGTSMATPHVAGVAGLLLANDRSLTHYDIKRKILAGARPLASLRGKVITGGTLNAYYALTGQKPPEDQNDPVKWTHQPQSFSTAHPYGESERLEYEVSIPGANALTLYFSIFQTERNYDVVRFEDRAGNVMATMHGSADGSYTPVFQGDYVKVVFTSDSSMQKYGFDLTAVAYR